MALFWTSDTHFGHRGALRFGGRQKFENTVAMDAQLIWQWNKRIQPDDTVYHLGDFSFAKPDATILILEQLNGHKKLVPGNHDKDMLKIAAFRGYFDDIERIMDLSVNGQRIMMCHYPMLTWDHSHYGAWMLHGHSHGNCVYPWDNRIMDVGVDTNDFKPYSFEDIKKHMAARTFTAVDHHTEKEIKPDDGAVQLV